MIQQITERMNFCRKDFGILLWNLGWMEEIGCRKVMSLSDELLNWKWNEDLFWLIYYKFKILVHTVVVAFSIKIFQIQFRVLCSVLLCRLRERLVVNLFVHCEHLKRFVDTPSQCRRCLYMLVFFKGSLQRLQFVNSSCVVIWSFKVDVLPVFMTISHIGHFNIGGIGMVSGSTATDCWLASEVVVSFRYCKDDAIPHNLYNVDVCSHCKENITRPNLDLIIGYNNHASTLMTLATISAMKKSSICLRQTLVLSYEGLLVAKQLISLW